MARHLAGVDQAQHRALGAAAVGGVRAAGGKHAAGGRGERLSHLTARRCKPATPFGGKFKIIDFVLSNCVNSGIRQIAYSGAVILVAKAPSVWDVNTRSPTATRLTPAPMALTNPCSAAKRWPALA